MTKILNLFAGPGAGKSTTAAGVFNYMKLRGYRVELVTEYAKDLTYENNAALLSNQLAILGEQMHRLHRLLGKVDWVVTDSPLLLGPLYASGVFKKTWFTTAAFGAFETFDNVNVFIRRTKPYLKVGRNQSEEEAKEIDGRVYALLKAFNIPFWETDGDENAPHIIFEQLINPSTNTKELTGSIDDYMIDDRWKNHMV